MKRTHLQVACAALALAVVPPLAAQNPSIGVRAGVNYASVAGSHAPDAANHTGIVLGAYAVAKVRSTVFLVPEILYSQKGAEIMDDLVNGVMKVDYIEMPLLIQFRPPARVGPMLPFVQAGPTIAIRARCRIDRGESGGGDADCAETESSFPIRELDYGVAAAAGVEATFASAAISVEGRYTHGLRKMSPLGHDIHNSVFSLMLGVRTKSATRVVAAR